MTKIEKMINDISSSMNAAAYLPPAETVESVSAAPEVIIGGKRYVNFGVNGYLGLGEHPRVRASIVEAARVCGTGSAASRWTGGTQSVHRELERTIARFKDPTGKKDALVFTAGYLTNIGTIPGLMAPQLLPFTHKDINAMKPAWGKGIIYSDRLNHRSIVEGCMLAESYSCGEVSIQRYRHCDANHLERLLRKSNGERKMIVTDGVFSLHGHIAPMGDIAELAEKYDALVYVDDAHGIGVLGENGRGTAEHCGVEGKVQIQMGTFSKALGGSGGYVVANPEIIEYLRYEAASYIFQTAMPPAAAAGLITAINILAGEEGAALRARLDDNRSYLSRELALMGFNTLSSPSQIIPILVGNEARTKEVAAYLKRAGIFTFSYMYPAVPIGQAIIRINVMASHTREHLDRLLTALEEIGRREGLIADDSFIRNEVDELEAAIAD
ncbi:MAG: aminotransferase class I/II-fold pyridoxal phosphate-dependent enzyme [Blastocatellia bacterium]